MQKIKFYEGEDKHIGLLVHATDSAPFTIRSAAYRLLYGRAVEASGECTVEEHKIDCKIAPGKKGTYQLEIEYSIADEILIERIEVQVT